MQIIIFTSKTMWERAVNLRSRWWLSALLLVAMFVVTPITKFPAQFVSFTVILPAVFLLTAWNDSAAKKGIVSVTARSDSRKYIEAAEWLFPSLAGTLIASLAVFCVSAPPPWQFWVVTPLMAISFSLIFLMTEEHQKNAGRTALSLIWLTQLTGSFQKGPVTDLLLITGYPASVLLYDSNAVSNHPDTYVLASLVTVFLTAGLYTLLHRRNF